MRQEGILRDMNGFREHALRLTMALYRVSARFPEHEPLRRHCREYADEILARISRIHLNIRFPGRDAGFFQRGDAADAEPYHGYGEAEPQAAAKNPASEPKWNVEMDSQWDGEKKADKIMGRIDALRNLLSVAAETGWAHNINTEVLMREYAMLRDTMEQALLRSPKEEGARKNREIREVLDVPDSYHEQNPRQRKILQHIAEAKQAKISDFFSVLSGVSSKTIQRDLSELVSKNVLKREGEKRWTTYMLA